MRKAILMLTHHVQIDSMFALVEGVSTVLHDTPRFGKYRKELTALVVCLLGFVASIPCITDMGAHFACSLHAAARRLAHAPCHCSCSSMLHSSLYMAKTAEVHPMGIVAMSDLLLLCPVCTRTKLTCLQESFLLTSWTITWPRMASS